LEGNVVGGNKRNSKKGKGSGGRSGSITGKKRTFRQQTLMNRHGFKRRKGKGKTKVATPKCRKRRKERAGREKVRGFTLSRAGKLLSTF